MTGTSLAGRRTWNPRPSLKEFPHCFYVLFCKTVCAAGDCLHPVCQKMERLTFIYDNFHNSNWANALLKCVHSVNVPLGSSTELKALFFLFILLYVNVGGHATRGSDRVCRGEDWSSVSIGLKRPVTFYCFVFFRN